jgi:hypothetical protein
MEEVTRVELEVDDPRYPVVITCRAVKTVMRADDETVPAKSSIRRLARNDT